MSITEYSPSNHKLKLFKESSLYHRKEEYKRINIKYPDRIPIIVEANGKNCPPIDKHKFLTPCNLTIGQFQFVIRSRIKLKAEEALYLFINNSLPSASDLLSSVYKRHCSEDGFLYITYALENTFG